MLESQLPPSDQLGELSPIQYTVVVGGVIAHVVHHGGRGAQFPGSRHSRLAARLPQKELLSTSQLKENDFTAL